jgi:hypothetical protein
MLSTRSLVYTATIGIIILLIILLLGQCNKTNQASSMIKALNAEQKQWVDKYDQEHTSRLIIEAERSQLKVLVKSKDSTIASLAKKVKENRKVTAAIGTTVVTSGTVEIPVETIIIDETPCDTQPTYNYKMMNRWVSMDVMASSTKAIVNYKITNEFEHIIKKEKGSMVVEVTNKNPNTNTKEIYAITIPVKKRRGLKAIMLLGAFVGGVFVASR